MKAPNFFIAGAPKAGTTSLSEYLRQHPNVFMAKPKEPHYFADDLPGMRLMDSRERYLAMYSSASTSHTVVGEASVWYLFSSTALRKIREFDPASRIVIMLRNPVELAYSSHSQMLMSTDEDEPDFLTAWRIQDQRAQGQHIPKLCREPALLQYRYTCMLGRQMQKALDIFPRPQIYITLFDDFRRDTAMVYADVCRFLGISSEPQPSFSIVNSNKVYRRRRVAEFVERPPAIFSRKILNVKLSHIRKLIRLLNNRVAPRRSMDAALRQELANYFRDDIRLLETLIDRDLSSWLALPDSTRNARAV